MFSRDVSNITQQKSRSRAACCVVGTKLLLRLGQSREGGDNPDMTSREEGWELGSTFHMWVLGQMLKLHLGK